MAASLVSCPKKTGAICPDISTTNNTKLYALVFRWEIDLTSGRKTMIRLQLYIPISSYVCIEEAWHQNLNNCQIPRESVNQCPTCRTNYTNIFTPRNYYHDWYERNEHGYESGNERSEVSDSDDFDDDGNRGYGRRRKLRLEYKRSVYVLTRHSPSVKARIP